jgi:hypothetical protein
MLIDFLKWANLFCENLPPQVFKAFVVVAEISPNPSAYLEFETKRMMGRITFWNSGDYCFDAIDINDGSQIFLKNDVISEKNFNSINFTDFFQKIVFD